MHFKWLQIFIKNKKHTIEHNKQYNGIIYFNIYNYN